MDWTRRTAFHVHLLIHLKQMAAEKGDSRLLLLLRCCFCHTCRCLHGSNARIVYTWAADRGRDVGCKGRAKGGVDWGERRCSGRGRGVGSTRGHGPRIGRGEGVYASVFHTHRAQAQRHCCHGCDFCNCHNCYQPPPLACRCNHAGAQADHQMASAFSWNDTALHAPKTVLGLSQAVSGPGPPGAPTNKPELRSTCKGAIPTQRTRETRKQAPPEAP